MQNGTKITFVKICGQRVHVAGKSRSRVRPCYMKRVTRNVLVCTRRVVAPRKITPVRRKPVAPGSLRSCTGPYRLSLIRNGKPVCLWACGPRSHPDATRGECVCNRGTVENGVDKRGRRRCFGRERNVRLPTAPGEQLYRAPGREAHRFANQRGYSFTNEVLGMPNSVVRQFEI